MASTVRQEVLFDMVSRVFTFDDVSNVMIRTDKCGINGTINAQVLLHGLRVTCHEGVWLTSFVNKYFVVLRTKKITNIVYVLRKGTVCVHACFRTSP